MKTIIVTTAELKTLGLLKLEEPAMLRIKKIEKKTIGNGYVVTTTDTKISSTGVFQIDGLRFKSAIGAALLTDSNELAGFEIRQFVGAINQTADTDRSSLRVIYHKTVKNLLTKATAEMVALDSDLTLGEEVTLSEGYEVTNQQADDFGKRFAFDGDVKVNAFGFEPSAVANRAFESLQSNVNAQIKLETMRSHQTAQPVNTPATKKVVEDEFIG